MVFERLVQVLVFGCGYERVADSVCSATTLRRRRDEWITAGVTDGYGIPLVTDPAPANTRDHTLLPATLDRFTALHTALGPPGLDPLPMGHPAPKRTHPMTYWPSP